MDDPRRDVRSLDAAGVVWDWLCLRHALQASSAILCLGSFDPTAARYAAQLYRQNWAPRLIFSGGIAHHGDLLATGWDKPEAEIFATVANREGVPRDAIILETASTNTGENFRFTRLGLQSAQTVTAAVLSAFKYLASHGCDRHLVAGYHG